mmetsp:Transcript_4671/g.8110  ORF Transcript_4671/g.8110 Transcript_4671/m.8110 type:complete len:306 (-) Transcript_4671:397-1314(-)
MGVVENLVEARTRPAFEKLIIGPFMVLGEMVTGGHYMEVLRLGKQLTVGRQTAPSYWSLHKSFVAETGYVGAFYRGFLPWGLCQSIKGIPVLFVQNESMYQLRKRAGWSPQRAETASGFIGGATQAVFVTPFQKIKVTVVACEKMNSMHPWQACSTVVRQYGLPSLYDGVIPMVMRRSLDWGIRFTVSNGLKNRWMRYKRETGQPSDELHMHELIVCGLGGGATSALSYPFDTMITNSQKPLPPGTSRDLISVVRRMYQESGTLAFTRGWTMKICDNSWHMAWMFGVGTVVYDQLRKTLNNTTNN